MSVFSGNWTRPSMTAASHWAVGVTEAPGLTSRTQDRASLSMSVHVAVTWKIVDPSLATWLPLGPVTILSISTSVVGIGRLWISTTAFSPATALTVSR